MNYLVDTNILTRIADPAHAMHQEALDAVKLLIQQGHRLHVVPQKFYWERLVISTPVVGKNGHDARLVAAMTVHRLTHLLTFNAQDFRQYPAITAVTPADVLTP